MDHILRIRIAARGLAEGKNPPICDSCNDSIDPEEQTNLHEYSPEECTDRECQCHLVRTFKLNCLILHPHGFNEVLCEKCRLAYFSKLPVLEEDKVEKVERMTVRAVMGQEMRVS